MLLSEVITLDSARIIALVVLAMAMGLRWRVRVACVKVLCKEPSAGVASIRCMEYGASMDDVALAACSKHFFPSQCN